MREPKPRYSIELTTEEEQELRKLASSHTAPHAKLKSGIWVVCVDEKTSI